MAPWSSSTTRSATCRANGISWVAIKNGGPVGRERSDGAEHLVDEFPVEGARHLVEQEQAGPCGDGPHDRDPLVLAAGEPVGIGIRELEQPDRLQQLPPATFRGGGRCGIESDP